MKRTWRVISFALLMISLVTVLSVAALADDAGNDNLYSATGIFDWEERLSHTDDKGNPIIFSYLEGAGSNGQGGKQCKTTLGPWVANAVLNFRALKDEATNQPMAPENDIATYDPQDKSLTLEFNKAGWQSLFFFLPGAFNTNSDYVLAPYTYITLDIYYDGGKFPEMTIGEGKKYGKIDENGVGWAWENYADSQAEDKFANAKQFGKLVQGWNTLTIVGMTQYNENAEIAGCNWYLSLGEAGKVNAVDGLSKAEMNQMFCMKSDVAATPFAFQSVEKGKELTSEALTANGNGGNMQIYLRMDSGERGAWKVRNVGLGVLDKEATRFMKAVRDMTKSKDPAEQYGLFKQATAYLAEDGREGQDAAELKAYEDFKTTLEALKADKEAEIDKYLADAAKETKLDAKWEPLKKAVLAYFAITEYYGEDYQASKALRDAVDAYNAQVAVVNRSIAEAIVVSGAVTVKYVPNANIAAVIADIKSKVAPEEN